MATTEFFNAIDGVWSLKDRIVRFFKGREEEKQSALRSIAIALQETYLYYERVKSKGTQDRDSEERLVKYWSAAAVAMRPVDQHLALICSQEVTHYLSQREFVFSERGLQMRPLERNPEWPHWPATNELLQKRIQRNDQRQ
jgi:hypothetical protein